MSHRRSVMSWTQFRDRTRRQKREAVIKLREKIRRDAPRCGGRFTTWVLPGEVGRPQVYQQHFDFQVLSRKDPRTTIWNCQVTTARDAFWSAAGALASDRAWAMLSLKDLSEFPTIHFDPQRSPSGKVTSYVLRPRDEIRYPQFDGRTLSEEIEMRTSEIILNEPPVIYEQFELDAKFEYGTGVHIVLDASVIDQAVIEALIDKFYEADETNWKSIEPVLRERLPVISEDKALRQFHSDGDQANDGTQASITG